MDAQNIRDTREVLKDGDRLAAIRWVRRHHELPFLVARMVVDDIKNQEVWTMGDTKSNDIILEPCREFGVMQVRRRRPCPRGERRYLVFDGRTNKALEEFRYRSDAEDWARKNAQG